MNKESYWRGIQASRIRRSCVDINLCTYVYCQSASTSVALLSHGGEKETRLDYLSNSSQNTWSTIEKVGYYKRVIRSLGYNYKEINR